MAEKVCRKCGFTFSLGGRCKECARNYHLEYNKNNALERKKIAHEYYLANKEKIKKQTAEWGKNNKDKMRAYYAKWIAKNPNRHTIWRNKNIEKCLIVEGLWRYKNRDLVIAAQHRYAKNNPLKLRIKSANRRAKIKANGGKLSKDIAEKLLVKQRGRCACCGVNLNDKYELDHILPLALGGINEDWNMQLLLPLCNRRKNALHPVEYMQKKGFLI